MVTMTTNRPKPGPRKVIGKGSGNPENEIPTSPNLTAVNPSFEANKDSALAALDALARDLVHVDADVHMDEQADFKFETSTLTPAMIQDVLAELLSGGFIRTPAGYVSIGSEIFEGRLRLTLTHWKSFNFPEEDEYIVFNVDHGAVSRKVIQADASTSI
jgi:hypothetical protein